MRPMKPFERFANKSIYWMLLSVNIMLLAGIAFTFWPYKTIETYNEPFPIVDEDKVLTYGDYVNYYYDMCNYFEGPTHFTPKLVGPVTYAFTQKSAILTGCRNQESPGIQIPEHIPPGEYYLEYSLEFPVNPFNTIYKTTRTETFTVVK